MLISLGEAVDVEVRMIQMLSSTFRDCGESGIRLTGPLRVRTPVKTSGRRDARIRLCPLIAERIERNQTQPQQRRTHDGVPQASSNRVLRTPCTPIAAITMLPNMMIAATMVGRHARITGANAVMMIKV